MEQNLSDRRFDLILEKLDRIGDELAKTNKRLDNDENFLRIARELEISEITVKIHRGRVMGKMGAQSLAELVRMAERLEFPTLRDQSTKTK